MAPLSCVRWLLSSLPASEASPVTLASSFWLEARLSASPLVPDTSPNTSPMSPMPDNSTDAAPPMPALMPMPAVAVVISMSRMDAASTLTAPPLLILPPLMVAATLLPSKVMLAAAPTPVPRPPATMPLLALISSSSSADTSTAPAATVASTMPAWVVFAICWYCAMPAMAEPPANAPLTTVLMKRVSVCAETSTSPSTPTFVATPALPMLALVCVCARFTTSVPATAAAPAAPVPALILLSTVLSALTVRLAPYVLPPATDASVLLENTLTTPVPAPPARPAATPTTVVCADWLPCASTEISPLAATFAFSSLATVAVCNTVLDAAPEALPPAPAAAPITKVLALTVLLALTWTSCCALPNAVALKKSKSSWLSAASPLPVPGCAVPCTGSQVPAQPLRSCWLMEAPPMLASVRVAITFTPAIIETLWPTIGANVTAMLVPSVLTA